MSDNITHLPISPYREAWTWIAQNSGTHSASSLAKLLLTPGSGGFPIAECLKDLDDTRLDLAPRVVNHFAVYDRDSELIDIERQIATMEPRLGAVVRTVATARQDLRARWRAEDR
jgi:hypothetical protein